jgi:adenylate cyclase class 1
VTSNHLRPIKFGLPGEEIDKKDLLAIIRRFQNLHKLQLQRIQSSLSPRQRDFLHILPLLFHTSHPLLPGFISLETPVGIPDYIPSRHTLACAQRLSKSFEFKRRALQDYPIHGLYLMGSVSSIAYSKKSDLDIWLCHDPDLEAEGLEELRQKSASIETWAASLGLEVHIFFINPRDFRQGVGAPISTESCGSIQHHLLLEEFYRTSLYMAGRIPAWWLVPTEQDEQYTVYLSHLREKRFINERDIIDLGGMEHISADEFLGGTLWHLYKAIDAPHKSLLKLMLMESYASEYPKPEWLCTRLKSAVYAGNLDVNELDSYILMYRKVESYLLGCREYERLDLARHCFYLKINELLSVPTTSTIDKHDRRAILRNMIDTWGWSHQHLQTLDSRHRWPIWRVLEEQKPFSRELNQGYQSVSRFAREHVGHGRHTSDEVMLLGRRLHAALERKPGKVEILSRDRHEAIEQEDFSLHQIRFADGDDGWALYSGRVKPSETPAEPLRKARSLIEILAWLTFNGFYRKDMAITLHTMDSRLTPQELRDSLNVLAAFRRRQGAQVDSLDAYVRPSRIEACALFVNIGCDFDSWRNDGLQIASSRFDALSFGAHRVNLIQTIDQITLSSWQEVLVHRQKGLTGLFDCLCAFMNKSPDMEPPPVFECFSFSSSRSRSISLRIQRLYQDLRETFREMSAPRYIVRGGTEFFIFEQREGVIRYWSIPDEVGLLAELAAPRPKFSPVVFDRAALDASPLPLIYQKNQPGWVQIFCMPGPHQAEIFVLDERGSLFHRIHPNVSFQFLLGPYAMLVGAVQQRYVTTVLGVEYYWVERSARERYDVIPLEFTPGAGGKLNIRIFGLELEPGRTAYSVFCNEQEFSSMDAGQGLFALVAAHILQLRQGGEQYPVYITDIDVPPAVLGAETVEQLQTVHFLKYKQKIEERLNGVPII